MSEETLASAVAVPDQEVVRQSPELTTKRRQSSVSEHESKRRRLSSQGNISPQSERRRPSSPPAETNGTSERKPVRPRGGREEDRKRGQRLFGGLLGTLSQKPSNAAQRRRADIEKKQQDKLKTQDVEYGEMKKRRKEQREEIRRREKPLYEREAMQTRHANMIAMAHFLKTRTEPVLYYKPWQSRPGDEAVIKEQIEEAEATIAREVAEFEAKYPPEAFAPEQPPLDGTQKEAEQEEKPKPEQQEQTDTKPDQPAPQPQADPTDSEPKEEAQNVPEPVGIETNDGASDPIKTGGMSTNAEESVHDQNEAHRDDDGGEVVEDNEDTVIY